jgi:putative CocE/NonD family hydrolase
MPVQNPAVTVTRDFPALMRDGVTLRADVYRPAADGTYPVLVTRTAYDKAAGRGRTGSVYAELAASGYVVAAQDVRGRFASEGDFVPFTSPDHYEVEDGYDTVEWAARLPGTTGKVGIFGQSGGAWSAWCAALGAPPSLAAMFAEGISPRLTDNEALFRHGRRLQWFVLTLAPENRRRTGLDGPHNRDEAERLWGRERFKWLWFTPRLELPDELLGGLGDHYRYAISHPGVDSFQWIGRHTDVRIPILHRAGWYDRFIRTTDGFNEMMQHAASPEIRRRQRLLLGPWGHTTDLSGCPGDVDFGPEGKAHQPALMLRWFDHWLKGIQNGTETDAPVRLFVMGENRWRDEQERPPARARYVDYYLRSGGNANTPRGDGELSARQPEPGVDAASDGYTYDPRDPVPSITALEDQDGAYDQRPLAWRRDVLVYQTPPLDEPIEVTGEPLLHLHAATSAADTDFTAKLIDVHPDGLAQILCYGIVRARFRNGFDRPELLTPGQTYDYTIRLNPTANRFLTGHRIRVDISSSDFPSFDRNHNTGGDGVSETAMVVAHQTVFHDATHRSRITLPVIPTVRAGCRSPPRVRSHLPAHFDRRQRLRAGKGALDQPRLTADFRVIGTGDSLQRLDRQRGGSPCAIRFNQHGHGAARAPTGDLRAQQTLRRPLGANERYQEVGFLRAQSTTAAVTPV